MFLLNPKSILRLCAFARNFSGGALFLTLFGVSTVVAQNQFDNILSPSRLPYLKESRLIQLSSADTTGGNNDFIAVAPGATAVIADVKGPGVIVNMWVTIASPDKYFLRRILLRMYWDGEKSPSVEVPVGDFFGTGFQYKHYVTPFLGMSSGGYYCYFPMPFNSSARVEVVNQTGQEINSLYYHVDYQKLSHPLEPEVAYFHASWRREPRTDPNKPYLVLSAEGKGHLVGVNMNMQSYDNDMQYLEGDELVYVDGEKKPSVSGTGTEDYFNSGWYFNKGEFSAPYHGLILKDDSLERIAAYRFHIQDAIPFNTSLRFAIEHGDQNAEIADYSSTAYWYQKEPHAPFPQMISAGSRIPLRVVVPNGAFEAEALHPSGTELKAVVEDMTPFGAEWSSGRQLKVIGEKAGDGFLLSLPVEEETYDVSVFSTRGPDYGRIAISPEGGDAVMFDEYSSEIIPGGKVVLKGVRAVSGTLKFRFAVDGKNPKSVGYAIGLDAFLLQPHRVFIPEWHLIGPFPNPRNSNLQRLGLDIAYPPERGVDLTKSYPGVDQKPIRWTLTKTPDNGRMDLYQFDPYEMVVVYALTYVYSPKDQTVPFLLGSDDGVKVFLNDREIHRFLAIRVARPDQDRIPLALKQGWNTLMLKIENNYGGYNFFARVIDHGQTLVFSPTRKER
jgi:hypothetical protein